MDLSIVIATLGNKSIISTIECINQSLDSGYVAEMNTEIIIVIPEKTNHVRKWLQGYLNDRYRILETSKGGQVHQRIEGFKAATGNIVMQLDDDINFEHIFISELLKELNQLPKNSAISPLLCNSSGESLYERNFSFMGRLKNSYIFFKFKISEGKINSFGRSLGFNKKSMDTIQSDWLPGGCIVHWKSNLILNNYFPFEGKAYMEDFLHSEMLIREGIELYLIKKIQCQTSDPIDEIDYKNLISNKLKELKVKKYYWGIKKYKTYTYYWLYIIEITSVLLKRIKAWVI